MIRFCLFFLLCVTFHVHPTRATFSASFSLQHRRILETKNKFTAKYSMALIVSLAVGTPGQQQKMVLDTGSQLSWIQCENLKPAQTSGGSSSSMGSFDPTVSSSFSSVSCFTALCKPHVPDYSIPTQCDNKELCYYSYFYADGTLAEGNLVTEKLALSSSPFILGCSRGSSDDNGILGMNRGRLSVLSQLNIEKFSYCVPGRGVNESATGAFVIGENLKTMGIRFNYVPLLTYSDTKRMPNLDPFAYTVPMKGIRVGTTMLNVSSDCFRANAGGSGQTIMDTGSELTYLVDEAYEIVREEVVRRAGPMMKRGYSYGGVADMCFDEAVAAVALERVGGIGLVFDGGAEITIDGDSVWAGAGDGVRCVAIGRSSLLGSAGNIIGNVHQRNLWVEFDVAGRRMGFAKADCSRS